MFLLLASFQQWVGGAQHSRNRGWVWDQIGIKKSTRNDCTMAHSFLELHEFSGFQLLPGTVLQCFMTWHLTPFDFIICYRFGRSCPYTVTSRLILWGTWGLIPGLVWESSGNLPGLQNALVFRGGRRPPWSFAIYPRRLRTKTRLESPQLEVPGRWTTNSTQIPFTWNILELSHPIV